MGKGLLIGKRWRKKIRAINCCPIFTTSFDRRRIARWDAVVSGELNLEMGGLPIFPEINMEVALQPRHVMGSVAPAHQPSRDPTTRNRRTVYAYRYRGLPDPMLEVFNQPTADLSCERRTTSTITPQVFTLFNSQNCYDRALAMAHRVERESASEADQIERAFKLAWGLAPTVEEYQEAVGYLKKAVVYHRKNSPQVQHMRQRSRAGCLKR